MSDAPVIRNSKGQWVPGVSGHPGGDRRLPEWFRARGPERLRIMAEIAECEDSEHQFDALKWCLERQYGKPQPVIELDGDGEVEPVVAVLLTRARRGAEWEQVIDAQFEPKKTNDDEG